MMKNASVADATDYGREQGEKIASRLTTEKYQEVRRKIEESGGNEEKLKQIDEEFLGCQLYDREPDSWNYEAIVQARIAGFMAYKPADKTGTVS